MRLIQLMMAISALIAMFVGPVTLVGAADVPPATLQVSGGTIQVEFADGRFDLPRKVLLDRIAESACAVSTYYGRFPAPKYRMLVVPIAGQHGVLSGTTWGFGGAHSRILIGEHLTEAELRADWIMTHEMVHTAFPTMPRQHHWIEEGIATYVEPLARSWIGNYPPEKVWDDLVLGLPKGMPEPDDQGLDRTPTWGRTYWGGAMYCTLADVQIRQRTKNQRGLIDALRGILGASGGIESEWPIARALKAGDDAVAVPVMEELYEQMKSSPMKPDLPALWKQLGVNAKGDAVTMNEHAPEASIRDAISARPSDAQHCGSPER